MNITRNLTELSHVILSGALKEGDIAVDCTAGNGNDTLFLANLIGCSGKVYSFDIQSMAINNTAKKLEESGLSYRVKLINDSHNNVEDYIKSPIKAAMYNLGYLPGGDHNVITRAQSTIASLEKITGLIETGGVITIIVYYGHNGGVEEKEAVLEFASNLDKSKFIVQKVQLLNMDNNPPILICIKKIV